MRYNKDEYGQLIYANMREDVSEATELKMFLQPKTSVDGEKKEITTGLTVGTTDITVDNNLYLANQYIIYTTIEGDLDKAGLWRVKGEATLSALRKVINDYKIFTVLD